MSKDLGWAVKERLRLGTPWRNWRTAREMGLDLLETLALFEEARRENEAKDWALHITALLAVLMFVALGFALHSMTFAQFSAPAGFLALFCVLFFRACHHHATLLARFQKRRGCLQ
jgi:hypothetical protein